MVSGAWIKVRQEQDGTWSVTCGHKRSKSSREGFHDAVEAYEWGRDQFTAEGVMKGGAQ
jgi:hypothetical protein